MTVKSRFTERHIKGMVKEYRDGSTIRDLAVAFECSTPTVIRLLHEGGIKKLRTKGRRRGVKYVKPTTRTKHDIRYQRALKQEIAEQRAKAKAKKAAAKKSAGKSVKTASPAKKKAKTSQKKSKPAAARKATKKKAA